MKMNELNDLSSVSTKSINRWAAISWNSRDDRLDSTY